MRADTRGLLPPFDAMAHRAFLETGALEAGALAIRTLRATLRKGELITVDASMQSYLIWQLGCRHIYLPESSTLAPFYSRLWLAAQL